MELKNKIILDPCCGSRMMWYDKENPNVLFADIRSEEHKLCDGRDLVIRPDVISDFRNLPFADETFWHVVFDPPHLNKIGDNSWTALKYGKLFTGWEDDIKQGFNECMRVLKTYGTLNFKWNEHQIKQADVERAIGVKALYGNRLGKGGKTIWMSFVKFSRCYRHLTPAGAFRATQLNPQIKHTRKHPPPPTTTHRERSEQEREKHHRESERASNRAERSRTRATAGGRRGMLKRMLLGERAPAGGRGRAPAGGGGHGNCSGQYPLNV